MQQPCPPVLAMESVGGFSRGPAMFRLPLQGMNAEMVTAFGILTSMVFANHLNSTTGGAFMRIMGIMVRIPEQRPLASVLVVIHLAICARESRFSVLLFAICFGLPGCLSGRLETSVLPLVTACILAGAPDQTARQAFTATGGDPFFLFSPPVPVALMCLSAAAIVVISGRRMKDVP